MGRIKAGARLLVLVAALGAGASLLAPATYAQPTGGSSLPGTWVLVSNINTAADGTKSTPFGPDPKGLMVLTDNGYYSIQVCRSARARFASNNRIQGTPEEYQAAVHGCNPHWGRYTATASTIVFDIEDAMYPNWNGIRQERTFKIEGNELRYSVPAASSGGTSEVVWRRAK